MIRIISGLYKGRRLKAPKSLPVRPTTDRAKEGLFNILRNRIDFDQVSALDLFCGTGNLSFELASRGCEKVTAVDSNRNCIRFVEETAEKLGTESIVAVRSDVQQFLNRTGQKFDLVIADPPYDFDDYEGLVSLIMDKSILDTDGACAIEHDSRITLETLPGFSESRRYGNSSFSFFEKV